VVWVMGLEQGVRWWVVGVVGAWGELWWICGYRGHCVLAGVVRLVFFLWAQRNSLWRVGWCRWYMELAIVVLEVLFLLV
jgi:hypothetical protein